MNHSRTSERRKASYSENVSAKSFSVTSTPSILGKRKADSGRKSTKLATPSPGTRPKMERKRRESKEEKKLVN
jgi:hypothetical protein